MKPLLVSIAAIALALASLGSLTRAMDAALIHTPELEEDE